MVDDKHGCKNLYTFIRLCLGSGVSDREIARRWGVAWKTFANLKGGVRRVPRLNELETLANLLDVDPAIVFEVARGRSAAEVHRSVRTHNVRWVGRTLVPHFHRSETEAETETALKAALEHVSTGLFTSDARGDLKDFNEHLCRMVELEPAVILKRKLFDLVAPDEAPGLVQLLAAAFQDGTAGPHEVRLLSERTVLLSLARIASGDRILGVEGVALDITARKADEQAARQLAAIVTMSTDAMVVAALDGTVVQCNTAAEKLFEWDPGAAIGDNINTLVPSDQQDQHRSILERIRANKQVAPEDTVRLTKTGRRIVVSMSAAPILNERGEPQLMSAILRDISDVAKAERRHDALLKAIPDMIFVVNREGRYLDFVPAAGTEPYVSPDKFLGKTVMDIMPAPLGQRILDSIEKALTSKEIQILGFEVGVGNETHLFEARLMPSGDEVVVVARDLTVTSSPPIRGRGA